MSKGGETSQNTTPNLIRTQKSNPNTIANSNTATEITIVMFNPHPRRTRSVEIRTLHQHIHLFTKTPLFSNTKFAISGHHFLKNI